MPWVQALGAPMSTDMLTAATSLLSLAFRPRLFGSRQAPGTAQVSAEPETHAAYGVDETQATRLRAWAETEPAPSLDVYLGRAAFGDVLYARLKDEPGVRLAQGVPRDLLE